VIDAKVDEATMA
jgi:hypothetical protein